MFIPALKSAKHSLRPLGLCFALLSSGPIMAEKATINFRDVEVVSAIESIAAITQKTFIVDPRVRGKISIISNEPVSEDTLYDVFLSALQVHGYQAVSNGNTISITPVAKAATLSSMSGSGEFMTQVLKVKHSSADSIAQSISGILGAGAKITVHEASNSLVITDSEAQINRYRRLLADLDTDTALNYDIIKLHNTSAKEVLSVASALNIIDSQSRLVEDVAGNRLIVSGPAKSRAQIRDLIRKLDNAPDSAAQAGVDVIYLNHAKASTLQPLLENMLQSSAFRAATGKAGNEGEDSQATGTGSYYSVQSDEISNALIVAGPASVTAAIKNIVSKLDKPRPQVLIEGVIAEVSETFFNELSVNLAALGSSGVFLTDFSGALTNIGSALSGATDTAGAIQSLTSTPLLGGASINSSKGTGIGALIQAIKTDNKSTLLSTPSILTLENEEAIISIGKEVPFVTGSYTTNSSGSSNPFQTIEREEVGTSLRVRPLISSDQTIRLEINQEVSNIEETNIEGSSGTNPTTDKKLIATNVMVKDGQTLVLGGLIDSKFSNIESKVPVLGDIPVMGRLFRSSTRSKDSTVLMVFIRPTIVHTEIDADALTSRKYRVLQGRQDEFVTRNQLEGQVEVLPADINGLDSLEEMVK